MPTVVGLPIITLEAKVGGLSQPGLLVVTVSKGKQQSLSHSDKSEGFPQVSDQW